MRIVNGIIDRFIIFIMVVLFVIGAYCIYDAVYLHRIGLAASVYKPTKMKPSEYKKIGNECIGWVTIKNTSIDYPIMQAEDNLKYLNTSPDGTYSLAGSVFLDWQNKPDFSDKYNLIHGHHMESGMFGFLDLYVDKEYFETHKEAELTFNGEMHSATVFAFIIADANEKILFDITYEGQYDYIKQKATYFDEPVNKEKIVCLSTCKDPGTTQRTMLFISL